MLNKKNKSKPIKLIALSTAFVSTIIAPTIVTSCSFNISSGNLSLNEQIELLKGSKQQIFDFWLSKTYASWVVNNVLKEQSQQKEKAEEVTKYLETLKWDHVKLLSKDNQEKVENQILDNFKFYVDYKSNIQDATNTLPNDYWNDQATKWKTEELTTLTNESLIDLDLPRNWSSEYYKTDKEKFLKNFRLLFLARGTQVFQEIMKMSLIEIYFLNTQEKEVRLATNYNKQEKKKNTKENIETTSINIKNEDYNLIKYLVNKSPSLEWNILDDSIQQASIGSLDEFNNLTLIGNTVSNLVLPTTNDDFLMENNQKFDLSMLRSYKGLNVESSAGDLSSGYNYIKLFGSPKVGLFDKKTNQLFSFEKLAARKEIAKDTSKKALPSIKLKQEKAIFEKMVDEIKLNDIEMAVNIPGATINLEYDEAKKQLILKDETNNQSWTISSIRYPDQKNDAKNITLNVDYVFNSSDNKPMRYSYEATISNWSLSSSSIYTQTAQYDKQFNFVQSIDNLDIYKLHPESISVESADDAKKTNISYYQRILPIFNPTDSIKINGEFIQKGQFSLDQTVWNSLDKKQQLSRIFALSDTTLWNEVQDYLLFNNFDLRPTISELQTIVNELGLKQKTKEDRKKAGIE